MIDRLRHPQVWDAVVEPYAAYALSPHGHHHITAVQCVDLADVNPGQTVVDLACGPGKVSRLLIDRLSQGKVYAVDSSRQMLAHAQAILPDEKVVFMHGSAEDLRWLIPQPVDAIVSHTSLHRFELEAAAENMAEVIKPGGRFVFDVPPSVFDYAGEYCPPVNPVKSLVIKELVKMGFLVPPKPKSNHRKLNAATLRSVFGSFGFEVEQLNHPVTYIWDAYLQLLRIPGLSYLADALGSDVLTIATDAIRSDVVNLPPHTITWPFFIAQKVN